MSTWWWVGLGRLRVCLLLVRVEKDKTILSDFIGFKETWSVVSLSWT